jgi:zinc transport system substrate-binding protein
MRTVLTLAFVALSATLVASCSGPADASDGEDALSVVTSFYPLRFATERIGGDCVEVTDLTPPGVEPHDLELTPDGVEAIATADVVFYIGAGFQPAVEDAIDEAQGVTVDLLASVPTLPGAGEGEEAPTVDPHVWLDPSRLAAIAGEIEAALTESGVPEACDVASRSIEFRDELGALDERFREGLADCDLDVIVTSHAAFGYLTAAYGLRQVAIAGLEPDTEPDPRRLAEIAELVRRLQVHTIFTEELVAPDVAETLARETGADTAVLATIEGLTDDEASAGQDYLSLMEGNLDALRAALGCA